MAARRRCALALLTLLQQPPLGAPQQQAAELCHIADLFAHLTAITTDEECLAGRDGGRGPPPSRLLRDVCVPFFVDVIRKLSHVQVGNGAEDKRVLSGEQGDCADSASPIAVQSSEVMGWIV